MFDGKYFEWNQRRTKAIIDHYGHQFFFGKKVVDLGCGYADISGALYRLGSEITAIDARQDHLKIVAKKFHGIKTLKANLDGPWPLYGQSFDLILDMGLACHLSNLEAHLKAVCSHTKHLIFETAVCDSDDPEKCVAIPEDKGIYDLSFNGMGCRPTTAYVEKLLRANGMEFKRIDNSKFNVEDYVYDWQPHNDGTTSINKRRIWFAEKTGAAVMQEAPAVVAPPPNLGFPPHDSGIPVTVVSPPPPPLPPVSIDHGMLQQPSPTVSNIGTWKNYGEKWIWDPGTSGEPLPPPLPPREGTVPRFSDPNKRFVIVIPSYNNSQYCVKNIMSTLSQTYDNYRVIFTDDCSSDDTFAKVSSAVQASGKADKVTLIKNTSRQGALTNLYNMIHSCDDDEIILTLDGDDWFPHDNVLGRLREVYTERDVWMTYGQYKNSTDGGVGVAQPYPQHIVEHNGFRSYHWGASHLRTFYAWLFKKIKKEDLQQNGQFFSMTWDFAMMFPMLEMSGPHSQFLSDILYVYNLENPINDHKVNRQLQQNLDSYIRGLPRYSLTTRPPEPRTTVGLLIIATGKYHRFIQGLITSADRYFMVGEYDVTYYIFSDTEQSINTNRRVEQIHIDHKPFPHASMDRFKHFTNNANRFNNQDYLFYVDVDCLFVDNVNHEVLGNLVGVRHCGFFQGGGPYESNPQSCLYIGGNYPKSYKHYFGGGFSGGRKNNYLELAKWCSDHIDQDVNNNIIPVWHDETAINRYFLDHEPDIILTPGYHYPQSNVEYYKNKWGGQNFHPRILLLDKNHHEVRT